MAGMRPLSPKASSSGCNSASRSAGGYANVMRWVPKSRWAVIDVNSGLNAGISASVVDTRPKSENGSESIRPAPFS